MNFDGQIHEREDSQFDYAVKSVVEQNFPLEVVVDETNKVGYFKVNESWPPFTGTVFKFVNAYYDDVSNHMSFNYQILSNPRQINEHDQTFQGLLFNVLQLIYQIECQYILNKEANVNTDNN